MPRNGSGSYTLPEAAFVPNTAISSSAMNSDLSDLATAMTASLARDGQGGMTAVLPLANAGFTYLNDPNTGVRRTASDTQTVFCGSVDVIEVTTTGASVTGDLAVSGAFTVGGAALLPVGLGPLPWSGTAAPSKWVLANGQTLLRADYPALWAFAQAEIALLNTLYTNGNGTTTFTVPDMCGRVPAGADNIGGIARKNRLTSTTITPDATVYGASGGTQTITLTSAEMPTHTHIADAVAGHRHLAVADNDVTTTLSSTNRIGRQNLGAGDPSYNLGGQTDDASVGLTSLAGGHTPTLQNTGSGGAHINVQPTLVTNYIIYAGA